MIQTLQLTDAKILTWEASTITCRPLAMEISFMRDRGYEVYVHVLWEIFVIPSINMPLRLGLFYMYDTHNVFPHCRYRLTPRGLVRFQGAYKGSGFFTFKMMNFVFNVMDVVLK